ncbi:MAG TPA: hypothetical protein VK866_13550 [Acidimicrobiales bacterium]|nr:hypothetical protein [Acidimicrobiales bacterium]
MLHPPYTAWHLGYVLLGAGLAPVLDGTRLVATLLAFFLAVGVAAHALDELAGRPLGTTIPSRVLAAVAAVALCGAAALGVAGIGRVGWGLLAFIVVGVVLVVGYNLELWGGRLHHDVVFAAAWGSFPVLTAYYAQVERLDAAVVSVAAFAFGLSWAQRVLSTEARSLRRKVSAVSGYRDYRDGSRQALDTQVLLRPYERALAALSWATCALGVGLVLTHL